MGLAYGSRWWETQAGGMVRAAVEGVRPATGVRGYYLPQEIEAGQWQGAARQRELGEAVRQVRREFHPLAVSGFANHGARPEAAARFWRDLQKRSGFDRLLFQDGVGARKMPLEEWATWPEAISRALGRRFCVVVETFTGLGEGASWRGVPAEWDRVVKQLEIAERWSGQRAVAFSIPEYVTPLGGTAAGHLFSQARALFSDKGN
jgi:hypothetical protein